MRALYFLSSLPGSVLCCSDFRLKCPLLVEFSLAFTSNISKLIHTACLFLPFARFIFVYCLPHRHTIHFTHLAGYHLFHTRVQVAWGEGFSSFGLPHQFHCYCSYACKWYCLVPKNMKMLVSSTKCLINTHERKCISLIHKQKKVSFFLSEQLTNLVQLW